MDFLFSLPLYLLENIKDFHQKKRLFFLKQNIIYDKTVIKPYTFYAMITIRYNSFFPIILRFFQYFNRIFPIKFHLFSSQKHKVFTMKKRRFFALKKSFLHPKTPLFPTGNQSFKGTFPIVQIVQQEISAAKEPQHGFHSMLRLFIPNP